MAQHPIVHVEIPAADQESTGKFYSELFGWKFQAFPELDYAMFEADGGPGGGPAGGSPPLFFEAVSSSLLKNLT